tara:strand:- start:838 stop:2046 length:1209 start_codon:yes stop_codon:yes gene_type:complete
MASDKIRALEDDLVFNYVAGSDKTSAWQQKNLTPPTGKLPSENLQDTYRDIGKVIEFLQGGGGEIFDDEGNVIAHGGAMPDLASGPMAATKGSLKAILKLLPGSKRNWKTSIESKVWQKIPTKLKDWLADTKPTKSIQSSLDYARESARKNIHSLKGFDRFLDTVEGGDIVKNAPAKAKMNLYKAWENLIKNRIAGAKTYKMSPLERWDDWHLRGQANTGRNPSIRIRPKLLNKPMQTSTAVHEATHIGQLGTASHRTGAELDHIAKQYGVHKNDMQWLVNKLDGADSRWELGYMEKIKPYLKKGFKITDPNVGQKIPKGKPGHWDEYALQPLEISARMSQIRDLQNKAKLTFGEKMLLKDLKSAESKFFDKKGIDYAVDKLWMAAPIGAGLNEELFKEIKE